MEVTRTNTKVDAQLERLVLEEELIEAQSLLVVAKGKADRAEKRLDLFNAFVKEFPEMFFENTAAK